MSSPARERILYRHYQYRDWDQIRLRIETRRTCASAAVLSANPHWLLADPLDAVSPDDDPRLIEWKDGEPLRDDPALPPVARSRWKPLVKYAAAIAAAPFRRFPTGLAGAGFAPDLEKNFTRLSAVTSTTFARLPA